MIHLDSLDDLQRQLQTNPNGSTTTYTDPISGQTYSTIPNNPVPLTPAPSVNAPPQPESQQSIAEKQKTKLFNGEDRSGFMGNLDPRDATNNFGYFDKPGWMGAASLAPGMLGMAGSAVNMGMNANNMEAVDTARNMLGLEDKGGLKDVMRDNQGYVGDVGINDKQYGVSLEAMTPDGRTALTPMEALNRGNLLGGLEEKKNDNVHQGFLDSVFDDASNFFDSLFNDSPTQASQRTGMDMSRFPDAPKSDAPDISGNTAGPWGAAGNTFKSAAEGGSEKPDKETKGAPGSEGASNRSNGRY